MNRNIKVVEPRKPQGSYSSDKAIKQATVGRFFSEVVVWNKPNTFYLAIGRKNTKTKGGSSSGVYIESRKQAEAVIASLQAALKVR